MQVTLPNISEASLCDTNCVRLLRRANADKIGVMIDGGELQWVFDVSARSVRPVESPGRKVRATVREPRFWLTEIVAPQFCARLTIGEVIERIVPPGRKFFWGSEICQMLLISRVTLGFIAREMGGTIRNRTFQVPRESFAAWLRARWIGART